MDKERFKELTLRALTSLEKQTGYEIEEAYRISMKTIDCIDDTVFESIKGVPGHEIEHTLRVLTMSIYLSNAMGAKLNIVIPCALLHDIARLIDPLVKNHSAKSAEIVQKLLNKEDSCFSKEETDLIAKCVLEHSFSADLNASSLESKIVQDADKLDALGLIGVARVFAFGGYMGRPIANISEPESKETSLGHFYEKIMKLEKLINTEVAKKIAEKKANKVKKFIIEFEEELKSFGLCDIE